MKEDIAKKWTAALRSGGYIQGQNCLRKGNEFCCLGVLAEIAKAEGIVKSRVGEHNQHVYYADDSVATLVLPEVIKDWAGMNSCSGRRHGQKALFRVNDEDRLPFDKIADIIDAEWKDL